MSTTNGFSFSALFVALAAWATTPTQATGVVQADIRVSNSHLVATCLNGRALRDDQRNWKLSDTTTFVFTMRNQPRPGIANQEPGNAAIDFTPLAGHSYEIEVRADATAFSLRVWKRGAWKPVVRDRTSNTIVSSEPKWIGTGCR